MKKGLRSAFTMIELIFVIIILGILAVTALPRFIGVQDDARVAAEQGVVGAVRGGIALAHSRWLLNNGAVQGDGTFLLDWDNEAATTETFSAQGFLENLETGGAYSNTATSTNIFAEILNEPAENWARIVETGATTVNSYEGPSTATGGVATHPDLNTSVHWEYDNTTGRFIIAND